ncbi:MULTISPECIES: response regulator transcription factor [Sulfurimonas]|uniref:response regulator transcription factor n=1 Tax=Sulfurimonas TaxID=202746 RepID=UPI0012659818|nr:response regulator transcription factor [Sulfurimonas indica]
MSKILLLEDDEVLAETLSELLENEGFEVVHVTNGEMALDATFNANFELFLLDVNVPQLNGFELLKSLREAENTTPAIFITSLNDIASLSKGFEIGADDYIKKPFDFDELLVRIKALIRKSYHSRSNLLSVANFAFDIEKNELYKDDIFVKLSPYELQIVRLFFKNLNQTLLKEDLLEELGDGREMSEGALRVHIAKLRKTGLNITTIKGIGYRLASS